MRDCIMPNDVVLHKPTGETIVVCGVNHEKGELVASGWPFPSIYHVEDCEIVEQNYEHECQSVQQIDALRKEGLVSFIDVRSAMYHGVIP